MQNLLFPTNDVSCLTVNSPEIAKAHHCLLSVYDQEQSETCPTSLLAVNKGLNPIFS